MMYDSWASFNDDAEPFFLGKEHASISCDFSGIPRPQTNEEIKAAQEEMMSYAVARLILSRFANSPGANNIEDSVSELMAELGYGLTYTSTDYTGEGTPAAAGNYLAACMINYGLQDGSNEVADYDNLYYETVNDPLVVSFSGNAGINDPNRWQPLTLDVFIDQAGNVIPFNTPGFLGPEWGNVIPFALVESDRSIYMRDGNEYIVYKDPGPPPLLDVGDEGYFPEEYKWGFALVAVWSSQLDPEDGVMWDISPGNMGNISSFPSRIVEYRNFYNLIDGGDPGTGWETNPVTGEPYAEQIVPRADYARVLAEFWADGPDSETPPGHWFTILNKVSDHPDFESKYMGQGELLDPLEWDVKAYFTLGGAMHDAAITAWGIKGWYDYIRPVSAIRYMAGKGQSSDTSDISYDPHGLPLIDGYIEIIREGDPLAETNPSLLGKVKLYAWRGPDAITNPETDEAGVGWILGEDWWPYQRPSFVTPNFAGYVSGHSTYSRAAAEVMTLLTGDAYFPGGVGEFFAERNEFLVFEEGPSVDVVLQWATYRDASDQTSLSRIWGGIHPPADDIPGRIIGEEIGIAAFEKARTYFNSTTTSTDDFELEDLQLSIYPNPLDDSRGLFIINRSETAQFNRADIFDAFGRKVLSSKVDLNSPGSRYRLDLGNLSPGSYVMTIFGDRVKKSMKLILVD
jgi:hypothetical protein